eukprot:gnl/TRDRNA2_/TRDRNA2_85698_c0_seq1.p1 gnl/TRDRNA2_/TRDRNA2_85698_c0~~gnl/TRDRNA2_/TRDRNA2_85698_c0_seq1.p1  ORF type:complete len:632 (-),score=88.81 gnl/TRDRNA2_/TRDRNA2_85698_c0_seq1:238-2133(-)
MKLVAGLLVAWMAEVAESIPAVHQPMSGGAFGRSAVLSPAALRNTSQRTAEHISEAVLSSAASHASGSPQKVFTAVAPVTSYEVGFLSGGTTQLLLSGCIAIGLLLAGVLAVVLRSAPAPPPVASGRMAPVAAPSAAGASTQTTAPTGTRILMICCMNLAYGFVLGSQGLLVAPLEAERLWPGHSSQALGLFATLVGVAQLVGPQAGHMSDTYRSPYGRRRPMLVILVTLVWSWSFSLWLLSAQNLRWAYAGVFFLQQVTLNMIQTTSAGLLADLVPAARRGFAGGASASHVLTGALAAFGSMRVLSGVDYHVTYAIIAGLTVLCCGVVCFAANEKPSIGRPASDNHTRSWASRIAEHYTFDFRKHRDFALLLCTKTAYCAAVCVKGFLFFFCQDTFQFPQLAQDKVVVSKLSFAAEAAAALAAVCTMLMLDAVKTPQARRSPTPTAAMRGSISDSSGLTPPRSLLAVCAGALWMAVFWLGPLYVGREVDKTPAAGRPAAADAWMPVMVCGTAIWGIGQGVYAAGDQALALALLPDPEQASRYLGFNSICAFLGATVGGTISGGLLAVFGSGAPKGYAFPGYAAIFILASVLSLTIACTASRIRMKPETATAFRKLKDQPVRYSRWKAVEV